MQNKHFYDLTLHYVKDNGCKVLSAGPQFEIINDTILLSEGPVTPNAINLRNMLQRDLLSHYGLSLDEVTKKFTMVTDGAAVMARMAGSSISRVIAPLDDKWRRCTVHMLINLKKDSLKAC